MLQDATRRWRSSKATKRTLTRRWKTFKCCTMLLEDEGDETRCRGCKYPTPPCALAKILRETTGPKPCGGNKEGIMLLHYRGLKCHLIEFEPCNLLWIRLLCCILVFTFYSKAWSQTFARKKYGKQLVTRSQQLCNKPFLLPVIRVFSFSLSSPLLPSFNW